MARYERFTFICNDNERKAIATLAKRLQRSQSDAVRFVVIEAAKQLAKAETIGEPQREREEVSHVQA